MRDAQSEFDDLGVRIKIITFDSDFMAKAYVESSALPFPLLLDRDNESTYKAYGLKKASWWTLYNPLAILKYLKLMFTGTRPGKPGKDWSQLGGNVLIDPEGIVRMHYMSQSPHDRPTVESILKVVRDQKNA